ncbi:PREDICTED: uncharacterized protein LOC104817542 [Tarenaya hassleriana]|uniref:uncharacterized protein LOC104817542 n=1 Tax=Tarenaya hassleriana TaxID=28532 RepID=UPI0008FCEFED|nr:PREDICTED: uncharacterized protein LOC104817542 [Tarenaya hassleriana]
MAEGPASPVDPAAAVMPKASRDAEAPVLLSESVAKDVMIAWFRGEFAAANAIIDALCGHLIQSFGSDYDAVMAAIHRRRLNWIPVLQMQKYHSIAEVAAELQQATAKRLDKLREAEEKLCLEDDTEKVPEKAMESEEIGGEVDDDSPNSDITDSGSREERHNVEENMTVCSNAEGECESLRASPFKLTKRFAAKELVRGHRVNVVKGLKLYEDVFSSTELSKLLDFVNELREAGRNHALPGETFVLFNKNTKGNKRELIQLGVPIFGHAKDEHSVSIEPIPALLQSMIDHLVEWRVISEYKRPNGCVINFFDEDEHSQPFQKPPHVDQPISTLVLSESTMVFGHRLGVDNDGNFRGPLTLPLKEGSLLVMRGNSAEMARHVTCPSPNKRVSITFFKLKPDSNNLQQPQSPTTNHDLGLVTLWQPGTPALPHPTRVSITFFKLKPDSNNLQQPQSPTTNHDLGLVTLWQPGTPALPHPTPNHCPVVILARAPPATLSPRGGVGTGTGVFLPWTAPPRKPGKHLPPRAQRLRLLSN